MGLTSAPHQRPLVAASASSARIEGPTFGPFPASATCNERFGEEKTRQKACFIRLSKGGREGAGSVRP